MEFKDVPFGVTVAFPVKIAEEIEKEKRRLEQINRERLDAAVLAMGRPITPHITPEPE